jgi:hypothetical protein
MQCVIAGENPGNVFSYEIYKCYKNPSSALASKLSDYESDKWAGMENQESGNLSTTNDYDDLGDLIYYNDDDSGGGGGREKSKITKPCKPSLINHRNIAYNILKYLENDMVENKEIPELGQCSECTNNILTSPIKALTILSCEHIFHRPCIEKQLLHTKPSTCPFPD